MPKAIPRQIFVVSIRQVLRCRRIVLVCRQDRSRFEISPLAFFNNKSLMSQLTQADKELVSFWAGVEVGILDAGKTVSPNTICTESLLD